VPSTADLTERGCCSSTETTDEKRAARLEIDGRVPRVRCPITRVIIPDGDCVADLFSPNHAIQNCVEEWAKTQAKRIKDAFAESDWCHRLLRLLGALVIHWQCQRHEA